MHPGVLEARTEMYNDWVSRWITNIDPEVKRIYAIATMLHPYFKAYDFIDDFDLIPQGDKAWAIRELRNEWAIAWKPRPKPLDAPAAGAPADAPAADAPAADAPAADAPAAHTIGGPVACSGTGDQEAEGDAGWSSWQPCEEGGVA